MDNIYRRDHEMAYISDDAVVAQQKETKRPSGSTMRPCLLTRKKG